MQPMLKIRKPYLYRTMNLPIDQFGTMYYTCNRSDFSPRSELHDKINSLINKEIIEEGKHTFNDKIIYISWLNYQSQNIIKKLGYGPNDNLKLEDLCKGYLIDLTSNIDYKTEYWELYNRKYYSNC